MHSAMMPENKIKGQKMGGDQDVTDNACVYVTGGHLVRIDSKDTH